jgi:hypothetical protein
MMARSTQISVLVFTSPRLREEVGFYAKRKIRVRGTLVRLGLAENPPHPNPLRASFARLDPASGERGPQCASIGQES